ncbi:heterokaryon incompatibility protein-domain-containing protein, partial [Dendryphion nanum]
ILINELPNTFQDAILVVKKLGLRYLWIDNLCIVQDNEADWKAHVTEMANIYANAFITIAAGAIEDDDGGIFNRVPLEYIKPIKFAVEVDSIVHGSYARSQVQHYLSKNSPYEHIPLLTPGWVLQEQYLSKRYLCFGPHEITWECREELACSCTTFPNGYNPRAQGRSGWPHSLCNGNRIAQIAQLSSHEIKHLWQDIVCAFSQRDLTFPSDRLPALAGVAEVFKKHRSSRYLMGLWSDNVLHDLAWQRSPIDHPYGRSLELLPSWTWAAAAK